MKTKENQGLKAKNIGGLLALLLVLLILVLWPWGKSLNEEKSVRARQKAEILGYQLVQLYQENLSGNPSSSLKNFRSPASAEGDLVEFKPEGLMGIDPWGQPYRYSIQKINARSVKVQIWSSGPDTKTEESAEGVNSKTAEGSKLSSQASDDILITLNIPVETSASEGVRK